MEGMLCPEPSEQSIPSACLVARAIEVVTDEVLNHKPVMNPVQDSAPDGQLMEEKECENQSYLKNTEETQFSYDTGLSSQELEDAIRLEVLRNRLGGQVNTTDADISMKQLRSEGLQRWNTDMDIEYQYETFNSLPVYYGGDRYDLDDSEEFFPDTPEEINNMMWNQSRPDGGDNNSVNTVNMTPRCRTVSDEPGREVFDYTADEYSDTSKKGYGGIG